MGRALRWAPGAGGAGVIVTVRVMCWPGWWGVYSIECMSGAGEWLAVLIFGFLLVVLFV